MSIAAVLLLGAASSSPVYPTTEVLAAYGDVCLQDGRYKKPNISGPTQDAISEWDDRAQRNGWSPIEGVSPSELGYAKNADYLVFHRVKALNALLFMEILSQGNEHSFGGSIFKKVVGGRTLYISTFGMQAGGRDLAECRLHDPLGDGVHTSPVTKQQIEKWINLPVKQSRGRWGSKSFSWPYSQGTMNELGVHFGFSGGSLAERPKDFNPYNSYGMTLVIGFDEQVILV